MTIWREKLVLYQLTQRPDRLPNLLRKRPDGKCDAVRHVRDAENKRCEENEKTCEDILQTPPIPMTATPTNDSP